MKKLLFLTLMLSYSFYGFCQKQTDDKINKGVDLSKTNTYTVEYNFAKGRYEVNNLKIKVGTPVSFKVSNINRLAYSVGVRSKDTIISETTFSNFPFTANELSTLISKNSLPSSTSSNAKSSQVETIGESEFTDQVKSAKNKGKADPNLVEDSIKSLKKDLSMISKSSELTELIATSQNQMNGLQNEAKWLKDSIQSYTLKEDEINKAIATGNDSLKNELVKQKQLNSSILASLNNRIKISDKAILELGNKIKPLADQLAATEKLKNDALAKFKDDNDQFIAAFEKFKYCYFNAKKAVHFYRDVKVVADNPMLSLESYLSKYKKDFDSIRSQLPYLINEVDKFENLYGDLEILYSNLKYNPSLGEVLNFGGQVKLYAHSNNLKAIADKMHAFVKELDVRSVLDRTLQTIDFLMLPEAYQVTFGPIQPINDAVVFDVKIDKRTANGSDLSNNLSFKHKEYTYGGTRIDFSLGLAGSYFNNTPVYELSTKKAAAEDASIISIAKKSNTLFVPSLVGMATMSCRSTRYVAYGASAGLGIDVMNGKIQLSNFYAGPSATFGKYERLTLTAGATVRNVGQLSSGYIEGDIVQGPADKISNFISDKYKVGIFISLGVNLTKGMKDNIKQIKSLL